jgi:hypothetical protein
MRVSKKLIGNGKGKREETKNYSSLFPVLRDQYKVALEILWVWQSRGNSW